VALILDIARLRDIDGRAEHGPPSVPAPPIQPIAVNERREETTHAA
jgi:hypothetical protein